MYKGDVLDVDREPILFNVPPKTCVYKTCSCRLATYTGSVEVEQTIKGICGDGPNALTMTTGTVPAG